MSESEQKVALLVGIMALLRSVADGVSGTIAHLEALTKVVCQLHPEAEALLKTQIPLEMNAMRADLEARQKVLELLQSSVSKLVQ